METFLQILFGLLILLTVYDLLQRKHAILKNFPVIGHIRFLLEAIGPELRQYIVTGNDEERPFSRDQRRWVYASSKQQNNYFGFGTDNELETQPNFLIIKHSAFPISYEDPIGSKLNPDYQIPCAKVMGAWRKRKCAFRPQSVINISGMSFGSLSAPAVEALNRGCADAGCLQNTGEGGIANHHQHGGDLVWQIGTGYYGCRDQKGRFDLSRLIDTVQCCSVKAIEIKLSQGAKPGMGGILPASKITREIAEIRGIPMGRDCLSPAGHREFKDVDSMLDFVEMLADATGLPVGIKSAVGESDFWIDLAQQMEKDSRGVDFITIDGGEGGTGAGPLVFTDHVSLPFRMAMVRVYREFAIRDIARKVVFVGSGKLGFPECSILAFALGCDLINIGREAMLAIGCIQAQRCHTGHCPTGVATQNRWLSRGLDPHHKGGRLANFVTTLRKEILNLSHACGVIHPALISSRHLEILDDRFGAVSIEDLFQYGPGWGMPVKDDLKEIQKIMEGLYSSDSSK